MRNLSVFSGKAPNGLGLHSRPSASRGDPIEPASSIPSLVGPACRLAPTDHEQATTAHELVSGGAVSSIVRRFEPEQWSTFGRGKA